MQRYLRGVNSHSANPSNPPFLPAHKAGSRTRSAGYKMRRKYVSLFLFARNTSIKFVSSHSSKWENNHIGLGNKASIRLGENCLAVLPGSDWFYLTPLTNPVHHFAIRQLFYPKISHNVRVYCHSLILVPPSGNCLV